MMQEPEVEWPRSVALVAWLFVALAALASFYGICILAAVLPFNSGAWVVGEDIALRGWFGYMLSALAHSVAAAGLWRQWKWSRWLGTIVLGLGLLPAVPGISAAVVDLRISGIAQWGALIVLRSAALYALMSTE